jgi:hypothetical protein
VTVLQKKAGKQTTPNSLLQDMNSLATLLRPIFSKELLSPDEAFSSPQFWFISIFMFGISSVDDH